MGVRQRRKNPLPVVRAAHGNGICILAHGEPQDPCPVRLQGHPPLPTPVRHLLCGLQCAASQA
jgi:hypothetical protein